MDYELKREGNEVILVEVNSHDIDFYVPEGVTKIGEKCFYYNWHIKYVKLSSTVKVIGEYAFNCSSIELVSLNEGLEIIENDCFKNTNIKNIHFPESLKRIGNDAFNGCNKIQEIKIPAAVEHIGVGAFENCPKLDRIIVDVQNKVYDSRDHCNMIILSKENQIISSCNKSIIPNSIECLEENNFSSLKFRKLVIPDSVKRIESCAFSKCKIEELMIGANVEFIDKKAFVIWGSIQNIIVDNHNKVYMGSKDHNAIIEKETGTLILALKNYKIESHVKTIASYAFYSLDIDEIYIPNTVECIKEEAFSYCEINKMIFGNGTYNLEDNCFRNSEIYYLELCGKVKINDLNSIMANIIILILTPNMEISNNSFLDVSATIFKDKVTYQKYIPLFNLGYYLLDLDSLMSMDLLYLFENTFRIYGTEISQSLKYLILNTKEIADTDYSYLKAYSIIGYLKTPEYYNVSYIHNLLKGINHIICDVIYEEELMKEVLDYIVQHDLITYENMDIVLDYYDKYYSVEQKSVLLEIIKNRNINMDSFDL